MPEFEPIIPGADVAVDNSLELPPQCKVIIYNDDFTTKEFVVDILISVFRKNQEQAVNIMESVHQTGKGVAGIYSYDIAVTRTNIATARARKAGFPLKLEVEQA